MTRQDYLIIEPEDVQKGADDDSEVIEKIREGLKRLIPEKYLFGNYFVAEDKKSEE